MLSYFPSLEYCYFESSRIIPHIVQDVIVYITPYGTLLPLTLTHCQSQQFYINSPLIIVPIITSWPHFHVTVDWYIYT